MPCSRASPCRACSKPSLLSSPPAPPSPTQGNGFQPSLGTLRVPLALPRRLRCILDPTSFEHLCVALVTPDSLSAAIAGRRSAHCLPLSIGSAVAVQSAAAHRRFRRRSWAASGQPSAETRLFGSEKSANQQLNEFTARISATFLIYFDLWGTLFISGTWGRGRQIINTSPSGPACPIYDL